jgi:hypothetical protein
MATDSIMQKIKSKIPAFLLEEKTYFWIFLVVSIFNGIQKDIQGPKFYNNYLIYKTSFSHLICEMNLYIRYWNEYADLFLYSPTFAVIIAPLSYLPIYIQVVLWCCLDSILLFTAIRLLPFEDKKNRIIIYCFIFIEYVTCIQHMQVAPMVTAFIIFAFISFEKGKPGRAAFFIVLATFIKIYAIGAVVMFLMYPDKLKFIGRMVLFSVAFLLAPLLFVSYHQLLWQYHNWYDVMTTIHKSEETGIEPNIKVPLSVMGVLKFWFNFAPPAIYIQLIGTAIMCLPFFRSGLFKNVKFRLYILSSLLVWAMIFNHIAESPSYIVVVVGVAIWYATSTKDKFSTILMVGVLIFTILPPTSLFPRYISDNYIKPYAIIAFPCIVVWIVTQYNLMFKQYRDSLEV